MITITIRGMGIHHDAALVSEEDVDIAERVLARVRSRLKVHCTCPSGTPDGPLGWHVLCKLHGAEARAAQTLR